MDKIYEQLKFFWDLDLSKFQADPLLNQLSREWEAEFESLYMLLAVSPVVHADEPKLVLELRVGVRCGNSYDKVDL